MAPWNADVRLSSSCDRQISSGVSTSSRTVFSSDPPTLLTHTSSRPSSATVRLGQLLGEVADVGVGDQRPPAALVDAGGGLLEVAAPPRVDHDVAAGVGQPPGDRPPDALSRSGDDGDPAVEASLEKAAIRVSASPRGPPSTPSCCRRAARGSGGASGRWAACARRHEANVSMMYGGSPWISVKPPVTERVSK